MNALQSLEYGKVVLIHLNFFNKIFVYCSYSTYDTTLIGLIQDGNESACRQEVKELAVWGSLNNLELNTLKTHSWLYSIDLILSLFISVCLEKIFWCTMGFRTSLI